MIMGWVVLKRCWVAFCCMAWRDKWRGHRSVKYCKRNHARVSSKIHKPTSTLSISCLSNDRKCEYCSVVVAVANTSHHHIERPRNGATFPSCTVPTSINIPRNACIAQAHNTHHCVVRCVVRQTWSTREKKIAWWTRIIVKCRCICRQNICRAGVVCWL